MISSHNGAEHLDECPRCGHLQGGLPRPDFHVINPQLKWCGLGIDVRELREPTVSVVFRPDIREVENKFIVQPDLYFALLGVAENIDVQLEPAVKRTGRHPAIRLEPFGRPRPIGPVGSHRVVDDSLRKDEFVAVTTAIKRHGEIGSGVICRKAPPKPYLTCSGNRCRVFLSGKIRKVYAGNEVVPAGEYLRAKRLVVGEELQARLGTILHFVLSQEKRPRACKNMILGEADGHEVVERIVRHELKDVVERFPRHAATVDALQPSLGAVRVRYKRDGLLETGLEDLAKTLYRDSSARRSFASFGTV